MLLGNGDGTFQPAVSYLNDQKGLWVTVADFNGDGKLDLAMNDYFAVEVLFGNGDGTFGSPVSTDVTYGFPMAVADFNGDGIPDLVAGANVMLGNGDGTFRVETLLAAYEVAAAIGDFNGDGKLDVAISARRGFHIYRKWRWYLQSADRIRDPGCDLGCGRRFQRRWQTRSGGGQLSINNVTILTNTTQ